MARWNERRGGDPCIGTGRGAEQFIDGLGHPSADGPEVVQRAHARDCDLKLANPAFHVCFAKGAQGVLGARSEPHRRKHDDVIESAIAIEIDW